MKKTVSMLLALLMLAAPALCERYDSRLGYSTELPEGWLVLNAGTYPEVAEALGYERLSELGFPRGTVETMARMGMECLISGDGGANAVAQAVREPSEQGDLELIVKVARLAYENMGASDAVAGAARFGENEFQAVACTLNGIVVAVYFRASGDMLYSLVFKNTPAEVVSSMLSSAVFSPGAEETAPAGAVFARSGALPRALA